MAVSGIRLAKAIGTGFNPPLPPSDIVLHPPEPRGLKPPLRVIEFRLRKIDQQHALQQAKLEEACKFSAANNTQRKELDAEALRQRRRFQERQKFKVIRKRAAQLIQANWRRFQCVQVSVPLARERLRIHRLEEGRAALAVTLQELRRQMHGMVYLPEHHVKAATFIQAWWRGILEIRVAGVLLIRHKIQEVQDVMERAVAKVQTRFRGIQGRRLYKVRRIQLDELQRQAKEEKAAQRVLMALKIQCWVRCCLARGDLDQRRVRMSRELLAKKETTCMTNNYVRKSMERLDVNEREYVAADRKTGGQTTKGRAENRNKCNAARKKRI